CGVDRGKIVLREAEIGRGDAVQGMFRGARARDGNHGGRFAQDPCEHDSGGGCTQAPGPPSHHREGWQRQGETAPTGWTVGEKSYPVLGAMSNDSVREGLAEERIEAILYRGNGDDRGRLPNLVD